MGSRSRYQRVVAAAVGVTAVVALAACGGAKADKSITIGTTDQVTALDPAGSYDNGSLLLETNIYQFLMNVPPSGTTPQPDAAEKCSFTSTTQYTCTLKKNQKFSNGDTLTSKDVVFSFERILKINNPNGPASLLGGLDKVEAPNASTVVFTLKNPNDQTWPFVLGTAAGPIVDSKVFPADKLLADDKVVGSGPYAISSYEKNQLVGLKANSNYGGDNKPKTSTVSLKYYTESNNLKLDIQNGNIDIAWRSLAPSDVEALKKDSKVKVLTGAGGELRFLAFNLKTMPGDNDTQKKAIRSAIAQSIDRNELANSVYQGTFQPAYSMIPQGIANATEPFKTAFGTSPNKTKAKSVLTAAGVSTPVSLNIDYTTDHYGPTSGDEYNQIKRQLEATGLFKVKINGTAWTTYSKERVKDTYGIFQLGWFPDFVDGDNFLTPFTGVNNFVQAHYCDEKAANRPCDKDGVLPLLTSEQTKTGSARTQAFAQLQKIGVDATMPTIPLLSGKQLAVTSGNIGGVQSTLDPTYQFRMWLFTKG